MRSRIVFFFVIMLLATSGCTPVQPWEREMLARPEMAIVTDPLETFLNDHIHFSKEASNGGHSATGGGCGCN
jgi:hypothetical protein